MAMTGFWVNGVCTASQAEAIAALNAQFPVVTDAFLHSGSAVANGASGALLTTWTMNLSTAGSAWLTHAMIFNFSACDPLTSPVTLSSIFSMPPAPDVGVAWSLGFVLPMVIYLAAWGFGVVVNMFRHH